MNLYKVLFKGQNFCNVIYFTYAEDSVHKTTIDFIKVIERICHTYLFIEQYIKYETNQCHWFQVVMLWDFKNSIYKKEK